MDPATLEPRPLFDFSSKELADVVTHCFEDYVVPFKLEGQQFDARFRAEDLDTKASSVWLDNDRWAALTFIARRGWTSRLAAMAVAKEYRAQGVGRYVMQKVVAEARERGDKKMVLEVIEQNPPAIALYERVGFAKSRRLAGYLRQPAGGKSETLQDLDPLELTRLMGAMIDLDLPWDLVPETLSAKAPPTRAFSLDDTCFALITDTTGDRAVLWSLFTVPEKRRQGYGSRMVAALSATYPGKTLMTPVAVPDQLAPEFLTRAGFVENAISQFEMVQSLV